VTKAIKLDGGGTVDGDGEGPERVGVAIGYVDQRLQPLPVRGVAWF
jgi:hypothetical protein